MCLKLKNTFRHWLYLFLTPSAAAQLQLTWLSLCVVLVVANGHPAFSICSPLTWVASKFLIASAGCSYPHWLSALPTAWRWLTAACHWRQNLSCGPTFQGGWAKEPCWVAWATLPPWNSGNRFSHSRTHLASVMLHTNREGHIIKVSRHRISKQINRNVSLFTLHSLPEQAVGCYCCLLEQERSPEQPDADGNGYVICFMGGSEKGLNLYPLCTVSLWNHHPKSFSTNCLILANTKCSFLPRCIVFHATVTGNSSKSLTRYTFRLELDKYVQGLHSSLQTPEVWQCNNSIMKLYIYKYTKWPCVCVCVFQLHNLETEVRPYLSRWYEESVMHIHRVVQLVQSNISFLLHAVSHFLPLPVQ